MRHVIALFLLAALSTLFAGCDRLFGNPNDPLCPTGIPGLPLYRSLFVCAINSAHDPKPDGYYGSTSASGYALAYGCGQAVCATSLAQATAACAVAVGRQPSEIFAVELGHTGREAYAAEASAAAAWSAAGSPCVPEPVKPDAGRAA